MNGASKTKSFLIALIIIAGLIFFNFPSISSEIRSFFYSISSPIQKVLNRFIKQVENSWEFLNSLKEISKENIYLEEKIKELMGQNIELREAGKENEFLRSYLNLSPRQRYQIDLANVIGRDFQGIEKYILIDKGSSAGIKEDMPVIVLENILAGKVIEVFHNSSKILLVTSSNSKVPALIQESRIEGLIRGIEENLLSMDLVPKDVRVEKGQTIITSGIEGVFPKGLLIGEVFSAESLGDKMFQEIRIIPAIDTKKLERVFIIKK